MPSSSSLSPLCLALAGLCATPHALAQAQPAPPQQVAVASLPRVVVTATRFDDDANTLPAGVSVLTADDIARAGVTTVNEAVMKLLGVPGRQDAYGGGDYGLDLRGFGATADANQVVVLDGLRINEADLGGTRLAGIPIDAVERIEVLRGSGAVLYGEGATGGVIVITTKAGRGRQRHDQGHAMAAAGSHGLRELRAGLSAVGGALSLDVDAATRRSDNHRANFRSKTESASVTGQWQGEALRVGLRLGYDDLDTGLPGSLSAAQYAADPSQTTTPTSHADIRNERQGVFGELRLGGWTIAADAGWRQKALRSLDGVPVPFAYDYDVNAATWSLRARHGLRAGGLDNQLVVGLDRNDWRREVLGAFGSLASLHSRALYVQDDLTLRGGTRLSAGVRREEADKANSNAVGGVDGARTAWQVGVTQPVGAGVALFGRVGSSFRLPNVDEFGFTSMGAALRPQSSRDVELGARWAAGQARAELRLYRNNLTDEIGYDPDAANVFFPGANVNFDSTRRQGVEAEWSQPLGRSVQLRLNGAVRSAKFRAGPHAGRDVPLTPRRTLAVRADWQPLPAHALGAVLNAVGAQHPDFANACRMSAYATLDLRYAYQWGAVQWALGVQNAADRKHYTQAYGCVAGETTSIYPEAGRTVTASARLRF